MRIFFILVFLACLTFGVQAKGELEFSTAGFLELENSGRQVLNMNLGWKFHKGDLSDAHHQAYDDSRWESVTIPHGIELLPAEASGCVNYQGIVWYRKQFKTDPEWKDKKVFLHFEAIMGKSKVWINGKLVKENYGGYLPVILDVTTLLKQDSSNVIAVCADNSDDSTYGPGKPQRSLDFAYFGGIYRDCFMVVHNPVYITDPNAESDKGGLNLYYSGVSKRSATLNLELSLRNETKLVQKGIVELVLSNATGQVVRKWRENLTIGSGQLKALRTSVVIKDPMLWTPNQPTLHYLSIVFKDNKGKVLDGFKCPTGIRQVEFKGIEGFWLNGEPYEGKLIGANRHQDFAVIGNAVPNTLQYRDAKKLKDAGITVIRCAHYAQDPAFLDACDALGIFVILPTAGWQFWSNEPVFGERIYSDIRQMVRRDRNHPSLFFWEPVLNETHFPRAFAKNAMQCVLEEAGNNTSYCAIDPGSQGSDLYPVIFSHPFNVSGSNKSVYNAGVVDSTIVYFSREFGDNVDDWSSHNSNSRACRAWGEAPMLMQSQHYAAPDYTYTCIETLYGSGKSHIGGTMWHAFDHQRGYHPIPFYGGIMDAFRQPKTSYYLFKSQRPNELNKDVAFETGPMVYIAHEMTPFSGKDVVVYSNCEEVRLTVFEGGKTYTYQRHQNPLKMPSPIITFSDAFDFMELKSLTRKGKHAEAYFLAEGLINGKVVASQKRYPSFRPTRIQLRVDDEGMGLIANGSDVVAVIAEIVDQNGTVKRLDNHIIRFSIEGEGQLLFHKPTVEVKTEWGSAPVLVRSTNKVGRIIIRAEIPGAGIHSVQSAECLIETVPSREKLIYSECELPVGVTSSDVNHSLVEQSSDCEKELQRLREEITRMKRLESEREIQEVEKQQETFGEQR